MLSHDYASGGRAEPSHSLAIHPRRTLVGDGAHGAAAQSARGLRRPAGGHPDPIVTAHTLPGMKRVLLTGMSGTGKSSVIRALADLGYKAIDTDDGWCEQLPDR